MVERETKDQLNGIQRFSENENGASPSARARVAVPSFFTLMNLFCGFVAITQVHQEQYLAACYLIILAGLFDLLDGMVARLTNGASQFGTELDSLCDIVSFGVAPAYLIYARLLEDSGMLGLMMSALPVMCAAVRLARFNLQYSPEKKLDFDGLPTPVQAYFIVAIILNIQHETWISQISVQQIELMIPVVVILSLLMVSMIRFDGVPRISFHYIREYPISSGSYIITALIIGVYPYTGLLLVLLVYVSIGLIRSATHSIRMLMSLPR